MIELAATPSMAQLIPFGRRPRIITFGALVKRDAHLGVDGASAADDASDALGGERDVFEQETGVDGEVVNPLLCLLNQCLPEELPRDVLHDAACLLQALVQRHRPHLTTGHDGVISKDYLVLSVGFSDKQTHIVFRRLALAIKTCDEGKGTHIHSEG